MFTRRLETLSILIRNQRYDNRFNYHFFRTYTTEVQIAQATSTKPTITWDQARPFKEIPTIHPLKSFLNFLPGGRYANKDINQLTRAFLADAGDILFVKGILGKRSIILTQNPDDFETMFRNDGIWPTRMVFELFSYYINIHRTDYFGDHRGLLASQGQHWFDFRRALNPILIHPKNVKVYIPSMAIIGHEFIERIKTVRDPKSLEVPTNFKDEISCWALESLGRIVLDEHLGMFKGTNAAGKHFFHLLNRFFDLSIDLEVKFSPWRIVKTPKFMEAISVIDDGVKFAEPYVQSALERLEQSPIAKSEDDKSILEKLVTIDRKLAVIAAIEMLFSGVDTSTSTFAGLLLCLATNPDKQQKLREEILKILPNKDSPINADSLRNLPYLRACLKESLRCHPVNQSNVRRTQEDVVLSGYQVPRDTDVVMVHLNIFQDSAHFSRPNEFIPERWLRESENSASCPNESATRTSHPFAYLPFGFGPRSCIGRRFVELEIEIGISRILRNFKIEFHYSTKNAFKAYQINTPNIPLKFKFTDLEY